jgi:hypothetical protein
MKGAQYLAGSGKRSLRTLLSGSPLQGEEFQYPLGCGFEASGLPRLDEQFPLWYVQLRPYTPNGCWSIDS